MAKGNHTKQINLNAVHASTAGDTPLKRRYERELENLRTKLAVARGAKDLALDLIASHQAEVNETRAEMQRQTKNLDQIITMERQRADMFVGEAVHNRDMLAKVSERLDAQLHHSEILTKALAGVVAASIDAALNTQPPQGAVMDGARGGSNFGFSNILPLIKEAGVLEHVVPHLSDNYAALVGMIYPSK